MAMTLENCKVALDQNVRACNQILHGEVPEGKDALTAYAEAMTALRKNVADYNTLAEAAVYEECEAAEKPFVKFTEIFFFTGKKVTITYKKDENGKKTDQVQSVAADDMTKRLSLSKFIKNYGVDKSIGSDLKKLAALIELRKMDILAMTPVEFREEYKKGSDFMKETMTALRKGGTPTSNTQIAKKLQEILVKCGATTRVVSIDIEWLDTCEFVHNAKEIANMKSGADTKFMQIFMDTLAHHMRGVPYTLTARKRKA